MQPEQIRAAYVHWPFCQRKCAYCDFVSWPAGAGQTDLYTQCVLNEIAAVSAWSHQNGLAQPLATVFFGGGTPSLARPDQLAAILAALSDQFGLADDAEITIEANPGTVTAQALQQLHTAGFNRISFGLQAAQDSLLQTLDRIHTCADFVQSVRAAREAGFARISADLMLGLPGQTLADIKASLDLLLELGINHISYYSLIIEPGTPFADRYLDRPDLLPDEALEREMYHLVVDRLAEQGIRAYEISNAAAPGEMCRHNLVYWCGQPYYGFGIAAHNYAGGVRRGNTEDWRDYSRIWGEQSAPGTGDWPFLASNSSELIDELEARKEMFLLGLRLIDGVAWADFEARFGLDARDLFAAAFSRLQRRGLLICDSKGARLTGTGLDLANQVFAEFV
ncbi:MAG: coproporphyrinogen-3 oxidase [Firmicutes bacterium]|nr:coproporphyrinogen-3 oxidase [Bacillota bacterium]